MKLRKILAFLLAAIMVVALFASCDKTPPEETTGKTPDGPTVITPVDPYAGKSHAEISAAIYADVFGEFSTIYAQSKDLSNSISKRHALMAVAEAKWLSSGAALPAVANGGGYGISRVIPNTVNTSLFGSDSDRFYTALVIDGDPLTKEERTMFKSKWSELAGTGTWLEWVKTYCAENGKTLNPNYTMRYDSDPATWDILATDNAVDSEAIVNTYDGLLEYGAENTANLALAESYEVSADGLTYTFHIRKGVKWVDYQGREIEEVTANSFVKGFQHMLDAEGGLEYLVADESEPLIVNADQYLLGKVTDFSLVGVKAIDDYTLVYTLNKPAGYFLTMFGYSCFAPMSEKFFLSKGGAYGRDAYAEASIKDTYTYGTSSQNIAYCGPYLVTNETKTNTIIFEANPTYYRKDDVNIQKITWIFTDGASKTEAYEWMKSGKTVSCGLNTDAIELAKADGWYDKYSFVAALDSASFAYFLNLYRQAYANANDPSAVVSTMTEDEILRNRIAMQNKNFRLAYATGIDRGTINAVTVGEDLKLQGLQNTYVPGNYVSLAEDVTIDINGKATTFKAGTQYGVIIQAQLDADGIPVKVWDPDADDGAGSSFGFDGWYNLEASKKYMEAAVAELKALGVEITKENPIVIEYPYNNNSDAFVKRSNAIKQVIEKGLDGLVEIRLLACGGEGRINYNAATYDPEQGYEMNTNLNTNVGWGPDYGDPQTYLDTVTEGGQFAKCFGLF